MVPTLITTYVLPVMLVTTALGGYKVLVVQVSTQHQRRCLQTRNVPFVMQASTVQHRHSRRILVLVVFKISIKTYWDKRLVNLVLV